MRETKFHVDIFLALAVFFAAGATLSSGFVRKGRSSLRAEGSCVGICLDDFNSTLACHCDDRCASRGDCCKDYVSTCLSNSQSSCYGRCFNPYGFIPDQVCYCDASCETWQNCCEDFVAECANINLCENRCFATYNLSLPCQCNDPCSKNGNCCPDYQEQCLPDTCSNRCGERASERTCQCDTACVGLEDCCADFYDNCTIQDSCRLFCGVLSPNRSCQCHESCENERNCCQDYNEMCQDPYLCNGECGVLRGACSCMDDCLLTNTKTCCTDYAQSCQSGTAWVDDMCTPESEMTCPEYFASKSTVILFSMDGFRNSYLYRDESPNLRKLASCGVHSPYMRPVYPTETITNHYTIATGLHPESHGIVSNTFYDHELGEEFTINGDTSSEPYWWGGEPIWVTARKQGLKSASYFWVGSEFNITMYPNYYAPFDSSIPDEERVHQVLRWLDLPPAERPSVITMYIEKVDNAGHEQGPNGPKVDEEIRKADNIAGMLMDGLKFRNIDKCVNVMILADHGMANISCGRLTYIDKYGVDVDTLYVRDGPGGRIGKSTDVSEWPLFDPNDIKDKLQCKHDETRFQTFLKYEYLPKRIHYAYNDRIDDVILMSDEEWLYGGKSGTYSKCNGGDHGWDNEDIQMRALFLGHGESLKRAYNTSEAFDNFELYNIICDILDITPAPNNGTTGSLNHVLKNPKAYVPTSSDAAPSQCPYPSDGSNVAADNLGCSACENEANSNQMLDLTSDESKASQASNMLMGAPKIYPASEEQTIRYCMLTQTGYVTAYDLEKKMPYYTSFSLGKAKRDFTGLNTCTRPDIRLSTQSRCDDFENNQDVSQGYLFHPGFLTSDRSQATILSNVIPVYNAFLPIWEQFSMAIDNWAGLYNEVNVILGPVFDYNYDGKADSNEIIQQNGSYVVDGNQASSPIPTHIFAVATKCRDEYSSEGLATCSASPLKISVLSFVIPNYKEQPCTYNLPREDWVSQTLYQHVVRVRDIELLTGISFFPNWFSNTNQETMVSALRVKVHLPEFGSPWLEDFYNNKKPNHASAQTSTRLLVLLSTLVGFLIKN